MESRAAACRVDEVPEGRAREVRIGGRGVALANDGGRIHAIEARCPHAGASLGGGWIEDGALVCPLHRWRFRLVDGRCIAGGRGEVRVFPVEVRDGVVFVARAGPPESGGDPGDRAVTARP